MKRGPGLPAAAALLAVLAVAGEAARGAVIEDVRVGLHSGKTRLVFDLSAPATYTLQQLANPPRIVIDVSGAGSGSPIQPPLAGTPISAMQMAATPDGNAQVTLFLSQPATAEGFLLTPEQGRGNRLVVDIHEEGPEQTLVATDYIPEPTAMTAAASSQGPRAASARKSPGNTVARSTAAAPPEDGSSLQFSGTWEQEWAYQTKDTGNQKFEALVEPRLDAAFAGGSQLVAIGRVRLDAVGDLGPFESRPDNYSEVNGPVYNDEYAELSLRELYLNTEWAGAYWRVGKQQVVWGQADGIKVLDVVNPQSFREFIMDDFDDSRIPLWMVNAEIPLDGGGLQLLWIPDTTYHELAEQGSPYFLTSPKWVPSIPPGTSFKVSAFDKPDDPLADSDLGARYTAFLGGWDVSLNYLYHYQDYPVLYQQLDAQGPVDVLGITPTYKRNNLIGGTLSNAFDALTLRAELGYSTDTYHITDSSVDRGIENSAEVASVVGLDWQYSGDGLLSGQWFLSYLPNYSQDIVRDESENTMSLLFQQGFANNTWQLRVLGLYSLNDNDSLLELKLKYWLLGNLELWVGGDFFHGTQRGSFGQFDEQSRALMGMEYGF